MKRSTLKKRDDAFSTSPSQAENTLVLRSHTVFAEKLLSASATSFDVATVANARSDTFINFTTCIVVAMQSRQIHYIDPVLSLIP